MPKKTKRLIVNPAVAALGVGVDRDKWTINAVVARMEQQYTGLIHAITDEDQAGRSSRARLLSAQATVIAEFLAGYYQDNSTNPEDHTRWAHRATRAQSFAFKKRSEIVENLHAGLSED